MPNIKLIRDSGWADKVRSYKIILDGEELCNIKDGQIFDCPISSGTHVIEAKIDWCGSGKINFEVSDEDIVFDVKSSLRGSAIFGAIFMLFQPNSWLSLTQRSSSVV